MTRWECGASAAGRANRCRWMVLGAAALCAAATVRAEHFDRGSYVTAMEPCTVATANTATSSGVPACAPVRFRSSCLNDPVGALRLGPRGRAEYVVRPTGPMPTRNNGRAVDLATRFEVLDVRTCVGLGVEGALSGVTAFRMTRDDPFCESGACRLPEVSVTHEVPCDGVRCEEKARANDVLEASGEPPLPATLGWTAEVTSFDVLDRGGRSFLTPGVALQGSLRARVPDGFATDANQWEARMVPSYKPCLPGTEDTVSVEGRPACAGAPPASDCAVDPVHAVHVEPESRFRKAIYMVRGPVLLVQLRAGRLYDCTGAVYRGSLNLVTFIRATLADRACSGGLCTAVDQRVVTPVMVDDGRIDARAVALSLDLRNTDYGSIEIVRAEVQDTAGNAVISGHGFLIRCTPTLCFGD